MTNSETIRLVEADPSLAAHIDPADLEAVTEQAVAGVRTLDVGEWNAQSEYADAQGYLGLLVLEGLLTREIRVGRDQSVELIGDGDLLRPWDHDGGYSLSSVEAVLTVLRPTRIAILDDRFAARVAPWPDLVAALVERVGRRARRLAERITISQFNRVDLRLLFLLWHMGERWGGSTAEGTAIPLRLTHAELAGLVGAARPSVSIALGKLSERGLVDRREDGSWLLAPHARAALDEMLSGGA